MTYIECSLHSCHATGVGRPYPNIVFLAGATAKYVTLRIFHWIATPCVLAIAG